MGTRGGRISEKGLYEIEDDAEAALPGEGVREVPGISSITCKGSSSGLSAAMGVGGRGGLTG